MNLYLVAQGNRFTGERGILGAIEIAESTARRLDSALIPVYAMADYFPASIAARAEKFRVVGAENYATLIAEQGPYIGKE